MKDIKKYLIGFIIWLSLVWSVWYASNNYGSIGAMFNITAWWEVLWMSWSSLMDNSVSKEKLNFLNALCLDSIGQIVWMKTLTGSDTYSECISTEWWARIVY